AEGPGRGAGARGGAARDRGGARRRAGAPLHLIPRAGLTAAMPPRPAPERRQRFVRVRVLSDEKAVARAVARRVEQEIRQRPATVLGLPTGRTPIRLYRLLREAHLAGRLDFSSVSTFNLDEFYGLPADHPGSYRTFMETHLFAHVNLNRRR